MFWVTPYNHRKNNNCVLSINFCHLHNDLREERSGTVHRRTEPIKTAGVVIEYLHYFGRVVIDAKKDDTIVVRGCPCHSPHLS